MDPKKYELLAIERKDPIVEVVINGDGPENRFRIPQMQEELRDFVDDYAATRDLRVAIFTGKDQVYTYSHFPPTELLFHSDPSQMPARQYIQRLVDLQKPIITALNGPVQGGGVTQVLLSDVIIAEKHAYIADVHVLGGIATVTGPFLWPLSAGLLQAKRYLLTGDPISAEEAYRIGLVTELVETGESLARAREFAEKLAALPSTAVGTTKRIANQWLKLAYPAVFEGGLALEHLCAIWREEEAFTIRDY